MRTGVLGPERVELVSDSLTNEPWALHPFCGEIGR